jgi:UDP-N-acetylglucosamine diphosphorylase/glucosamine-1-phosphate N-acetyltransferase
MIHHILFDDTDIRSSLLPFTFTRPVAGIRVGILTIAEKWEKRLNMKASFLTPQYLHPIFPLTIEADNLLINGAVCPSEELVKACQSLALGECLVHAERVIAVRLSAEQVAQWPDIQSKLKTLHYNNTPTVIAHKWDIFAKNSAEIRQDFALLTQGRTSAPLNDAHTIVYNAANVFLEEGANVKAAVINAEDGPVYIGKNAQVQEGSLIKGPFAMCEGAVINMGGKMRGDSTIGPFCKVGGEISNSVMFGFSNKGHDGFMGNSVIGEWCNLGADTNTSNLKNNYANVKLYNYGTDQDEDTGLQFCGLMMGDHSKAGINTMFNTGTVVGVGANIFGAGFPAKFIPSFAWGGADSSFETYRLDKFLETEQRVMQRRSKQITPEYKSVIEYLHLQEQ